jgi:hypothetical protein
VRPPRSISTFVQHVYLALLALLLGFVFALVLLPGDVEVRGALQPSAISFALGLGCVPALAAISSPANAIRAEYVLLLSPVYWLLTEPLQGAYTMTGVEHADVERAFIAMALFVGSALVAFTQRPWSFPTFITVESKIELSTNFYFGIGLVAFVLAFGRYAIPSHFDFAGMYAALQEGRWAGAWQRGSLGGADAFIDHLGYFGYILPPLTVLLGRRASWRDPRALILALASALLSLFLIQSGSRRLVGIFYGTGIVVWLLAIPRLRIAHVVGVCLLIPALLFGLETMLNYRESGVLAVAAENQKPAVPAVREDGLMVRVDENFLRLSQISAIFPSVHPYLTYHFFFWVAVRPIPRLFWPGKPIDPGVDFPSMVGVKGATLSASVIGELLMAGGFFAVAVGGWFYGRIATTLSRFLSESQSSSSLIVYGIGLLALFSGMRSLIELLLTSYVAFAWIVLVRGARELSGVLTPAAPGASWRARTESR